MTTVSTTPRYEHDCSYCHFVGQMEDADLYACTKSSPTVIARYSSKPSDNVSGLFSSFGTVPHLTAARLAAQAQGHLQFDLKEALHSTPRNAAPAHLAELKEHLAVSELGQILQLLATDYAKGTEALQGWIAQEVERTTQRYPDVNPVDLHRWAVTALNTAHGWMAPLGLPAVSLLEMARAIYAEDLALPG